MLQSLFSPRTEFMTYMTDNGSQHRRARLPNESRVMAWARKNGLSGLTHALAFSYTAKNGVFCNPFNQISDTSIGGFVINSPHIVSHKNPGRLDDARERALDRLPENGNRENETGVKIRAPFLEPSSACSIWCQCPAWRVCFAHKRPKM